MRLMTYNIHYCEGMDGKTDNARIASVIRDAAADIVLLQEVEAHWDRSGNIDQAKWLSEQFPDFYVAWGPNIDLLKSPMPPGKAWQAKRRQYGNLILSRYPILTSRNIPLPKRGAIGVLDMPRGALEVVIESPLGPLRVYNTHLCHLSGERRQAQLRFLKEYIHSVSNEGPMFDGTHPDPSWKREPNSPAIPSQAILAGDLNFGPRDNEYSILAGDYNSLGFGRLTANDDFVDAWIAAGGAEDTAPKAQTPREAMTHFTRHDPNRGIRCDYCFVTPGLSGSVRSARVIESDASDHAAIVVDFSAHESSANNLQ